MELAPNHIIVEVAKALGGSFKLVTLAKKNCQGDDSTAQGNIKESINQSINQSISLRATLRPESRIANDMQLK